MLSSARPAVAVVVASLWLCQPAQAQDVDPALKSDVEKLLNVIGADSVGARVASVMLSQLLDTVRQQQPQVSDKTVATMKSVFEAELVRSLQGEGGLRADLVRIYASHFTREDIAALLNFYGTDVGRKLIALMPQISEESALAGQQWAVRDMPRILSVLQERLRSEGLVK